MALYRVLRGQHAQGKFPFGHQNAGKPVVYDRGDIVESASDLCKLDGRLGQLGPKFERVFDDRLQATDKSSVVPQEAPVVHNPESANVPNDALETFSLDELKQMAESDGIDLGTAKTKAQIIKVLREFQ